MTLTASFSPLPELPALESRWRALEARADGSFFLGWTWMGSWLTTSGARPELLAVQQDGRDVALALVGRTMQARLLGPVATLSLNQMGEAGTDRAFIEYNGLLTAQDAPAGVAAAAMEALLRRNDWRALRLSGVEPGHPLVQPARFRRASRVDVSPAYHVDLNAVRAAGGEYLSLIGANTRGQIRRSAKDYGPLLLSTATTEHQATAWLEEMRALNVGRHADNAWDDAGFRAFAAALVRSGMADGSVEILRIEAGAALLGLLLNFVHGGRAMNYQSAFAAPVSAKAKPGLMCHTAAAGHYGARGLSLYSLLAGKDRYKQSLATGAETLEWWVMERFSPRLEGEYWLRRLLRRPASA